MFVTRNQVLEMQTEAGTLVTTKTQPVVLEGGGFRAASDLKVGDHVFGWLIRIELTLSALYHARSGLRPLRDPVTHGNCRSPLRTRKRTYKRSLNLDREQYKLPRSTSTQRVLQTRKSSG